MAASLWRVGEAVVSQVRNVSKWHINVFNISCDLLQIQTFSLNYLDFNKSIDIIAIGHRRPWREC